MKKQRELEEDTRLRRKTKSWKIVPGNDSNIVLYIRTCKNI